MMSGIIAAGGAPIRIKIVAAYPSTDFGGFSTTGTGFDLFGSMTPASASAIPRGAPKPAANGRIIGVVYELYEGVQHTLQVIVVGDYATVPFSQLIVDSTTVLSSWTVVESIRVYFVVQGFTATR